MTYALKKIRPEKKKRCFYPVQSFCAFVNISAAQQTWSQHVQRPFQLLVFTICWPALKHLLSYWTYWMAVLFMTRIKETEAKPSPGAYRQSLTALLIRIRQQNGQPYLFCTKTPSSGLQRNIRHKRSPFHVCFYLLWRPV